MNARLFITADIPKPLYEDFWELMQLRGGQTARGWAVQHIQQDLKEYAARNPETKFRTCANHNGPASSTKRRP